MIYVVHVKQLCNVNDIFCSPYEKPKPFSTCNKYAEDDYESIQSKIWRLAINERRKFE